MNIFLEVKEYLTTRQVAEFYGLQVKRNGFACCPFHEEKHPSMKLDRNYHCFGCGVGGDVIDYISRMFGLSQYEAALKLIDEFHLPIQGKVKLDRLQKKRFREVKAEQAHLFRIKDRFKKWCNQTIEKLKDCLLEIEQVGIFLKDQPPEMVFSEDYATLLHAEPVMEYWLDILCFGSIEEKQELFLKGRKEVEEVAERVQTSRKHLMERNRGSLGSGNEYNRRYTGLFSKK
ncbi:MAG: DNA primase [Lachnospiraceae bacterium]|nr:DNA primase [Lachnospiraceae bacterium]